MEISLLTIGIAVLVIIVIAFALGFILKDQAKATLSDKLLGHDWKVRSLNAFPMRGNCHVELYQDAAVKPDYPPPIVNEKGEQVGYVPGECWESMYDCINEAKRFIYITGWSVDTTKSLLRTTRNPKPDDTPWDLDDDDDETIGELLRRKANEGCHVRLHVWNERMSVAAGGEVKSQGLMCTHDEDTSLFFEDVPNVKVVLSYREGVSSDHTFIYTHHQKTIIVDAPLLKDIEASHEEGLKARKAAKFTHIKKKKELKEFLKRQRKEKEQRRKDRKKRKAAGQVVSEDEISSDEEVSVVNHELKMRRKNKKKLSKREKRQLKKEEKKGKKGKKHHEEQRSIDFDSEESDSEGSDSGSDSEVEEESGHGDRGLGDIFAGVDLKASVQGLVSKATEDGIDCESGTMRRIVAFVGGLDICDGRWDTPRHSLFRTLNHEHALDFHNPWPVSAECGPREPWHDIHTKVEGPVVRDVLENFVQRWNQQAPKEKKDTLLDFSPQHDFLPIAKERGNFKRQEDAWNVQLFRSIDKYSATIKNIDASIQECYINSIRNAKRFIYLENQYFLGSCQYWHHDKNVGCENLVPYEIANKICQFIRKKEQFNAYILIPMYPEGIPEDGATQEILKWEYRTQYFMNRMVWRVIEEVYGSDPKKPVVTDYLNFYCVGARETEAGSEAKVANPAEMANPTPDDLLLHKTRRFSIYVHSKMMIVDDVYVVCGSANINERSLCGYRDTEIAVGCYQPHYDTAAAGGPRGEVHKFRMSLWSEHLNESNPLFVNPNTVECVRYVNKIADKNWELFAQEETVDMPSHLLHYPIRVDPETGKSTSTCEFIPDTKGLFKGTKSLMLVDKLTT